MREGRGVADVSCRCFQMMSEVASSEAISAGRCIGERTKDFVFNLLTK